MGIKLHQVFLIMLVLVKSFESQRSPYFNEVNVANWTSCEEFLNNTTFNISSVLDIDWKIFYFWNWLKEETYLIKFSIPSPTLLAHFRENLDKVISPPVNWTEAELFLETSIDYSALLVKTNYSGLYRLISSLAFEHTDIPTLIFGFKISESGYLGIVNCKFRLCYALAPVNKMPQYKDLEKAAATLNFYGEYNRTYMDSPEPVEGTEPPDEHDYLQDDDDDAQVEISGLAQFL